MAMQALERLKKEYPDASYYLHFDTPFHLVIATILSAQTRDVVVNKVTPHLYGKYPKPEDLAAEDVGVIEQEIAPVTYAQNKAKYLKEAARMLAEEFGSKVPREIDDLVKLPGVGKKTANAIQQNAFSLVKGVVVDTHVIRLSQRLGWTAQKNPERIERDLMERFSCEEWKRLPHLLKNHGQKVCTARNPKCEDCVLNDSCPSAFKV